MGLTEVAQRLGVSPQRIADMRGITRARSKQVAHFPEPVAQLRCGPIWVRQDVEDFIPRWNRKVGRPRKRQ